MACALPTPVHKACCFMHRGYCADCVLHVHMCVHLVGACLHMVTYHLKMLTHVCIALDNIMGSDVQICDCEFNHGIASSTYEIVSSDMG